MKQSDTVAQRKKSPFSNKKALTFFSLLLAATFAVYLFLSLYSFDPSDPGWSQTAWHDSTKNWGGQVGAYFSDVLFQFFGYISYTIPILLFLFSLQLTVYFYKHFDKPFSYFSLALRIIGFIAFVFSTTGFFALNVYDLSQYQSGGILGSIVVDEIFPLFHLIGSSVILFVIGMASLTPLTGVSWFWLMEKLGFLVVMLGKPFVWLLACFSGRQTPVNHAPQRTTPPVVKSSAQPVDDDEPEVDALLAPPARRAQPITAPAPAMPPSSPPQTASILVAEQALPAADELSESKKDTAPEYAIREYPDLIVAPNEGIAARAPASLGRSAGLNLTAANDDYQDDASAMMSNEAELASAALSQAAEGEATGSEAASSEQDHIVIEYLSSEDELDEPLLADNDHNDQIDLPFEDPYSGHFDEPVIASSHSTDDEAVDDNPILLPASSPVQHDSLIHPFLQKESRPLTKPTTPLPSLDLLFAPEVRQEKVDHVQLQATARLIEKSLDDFRVKARVVDYLPGPVITRFEIELAPGIKASRISTLDRDLARSLSMPSVRVVEVIPGKPYVGIELPNKNRQTVYFRDVLDSPQFRSALSPLTVVLGKDIAGEAVVADLAKMPHLLVAGTTGSGKSVGVNAMILSILYKSQPEEVRFIMIDPKMLELSVYEGIPHLLTEVVTDMKDAANALNWCVNEMERRYRLMSALGVRNLAGYNDKIRQAEEMGRPIPDPLWRPGDSMDVEMPTLTKLPYIVVMVDEFADLIMAVGKKVEELIARLAQKARAAGIHLVLATQRPSVDVITGLIKANIPTRIAFTVSSKIDSRTILDQMGAESLLGMGDMLYLPPNSSIPVRVHGAFVRDEEVHAVAQDWKARGIPQYIENITASTEEMEGDEFDNSEDDLDPLFDEVVAFVIEKQRASISGVQRRFRIGYNRAARIVDQMEAQGVVSAPGHNGNRDVLASPGSGYNDY